MDLFGKDDDRSQGSGCMEFGALWVRNLNSAYIASVKGKFSAADTEAIQAALAGTTTSAQTELSDTLVGFQLLFGVDYELTQAYCRASASSVGNRSSTIM